MSAPTAYQLDLFAVTQNPDGSMTLTPRRYVPTREISVREASQLLNGLDREEIYTLIKAGSIIAWRPEKPRAKFRIDAASVLEYKARRQKAARG